MYTLEGHVKGNSPFSIELATALTVRGVYMEVATGPRVIVLCDRIM
jgi:hypothetical protein